VQIRYEQPTCPALQMQGIELVIPVSPSGCGCTSDAPVKGFRIHRYFYVWADRSTRELSSSNEIQARTSGSSGTLAEYDASGRLVRPQKLTPFDQFFVGTRPELETLGRSDSQFDRDRRCGGA
jgi:hypothetical protein